MGTLWNTYAFYVLYANIDGFNPTKYTLNKNSLSVMDKWILSKLNSAVKTVDEYLDGCADFAQKMSENGKICVLRLWNGDSDGKYGSGKLNEGIMSRLEKSFDRSLWKENTKGYRLSDKLFLEFAERFEWREKTNDDSVRCYGLRDQIGVLVDGRIVPCCIDCDGAITLGNIFTDDIINVINSPLAKEIADGFRNGKAVHPYCKKCGFVRTRL
jgi:hypothetical protein